MRFVIFATKQIAVYTPAKKACLCWVLYPASGLKCYVILATSKLQFTPLPNKLISAEFYASQQA